MENGLSHLFPIKEQDIFLFSFHELNLFSSFLLSFSIMLFPFNHFFSISLFLPPILSSFRKPQNVFNLFYFKRKKQPIFPFIFDLFLSSLPASVNQRVVHCHYFHLWVVKPFFSNLCCFNCFISDWSVYTFIILHCMSHSAKRVRCFFFFFFLNK